VANEPSEELQGALVDIQRYLLDQIPPLTASDAVQTIMRHPPELLMRQIHAWAVEQSRLQAAPMCDCLFHALKKVHMFAMLKLIDRGAVEGYLNRVIPLAMEACPVGDRELLRTNLISLRDSAIVSVSAVNIARAETATKTPPASSEEARSARRFGLVIDRLSRLLGAGKPAAPALQPAELPREQPGADLLTMAVAGSSSEKELQDYIDTLRPYTGNSDPANLLRILASSLPEWDLVVPAGTKVKAPAPIEAMHKVISLTRDAMESSKRFRELMTTAVEQFNAGSLSAAISMLELADAVIVEKKLDPSSVERVRADVVETINVEQLKKYGESKSKRALLPRALAFFPTLTKVSLLQQLRGEERPERRRALLGLLEAYGAEGREAALAELEAELDRPPNEIDTYYLRNVIYLLHRIPRESDAGAERELELLTRASARGQSIYVIKEAVVAVGQMKSSAGAKLLTHAAVKLLTMRLAEFEAILVRKDTSLYPMEEMQKLLDRIVTALARIGSPAALLTIARHGMKPNPLLGDTRSRLAALSQHDLSFDDETVNLIVKTIREDLPKKILGRIVPTQKVPPVRLIEALSSTRSETVEKLFAEIAEKYNDQDVGKMAAAALENLAAAGKRVAPGRETTDASLTGDLQFFGLPSLLQSLADTQATGIVTLSSKQGGQTCGKLLFLEGKFADAQAGHLRGADALYQLLERPVVGTFAFVPQPPAGVKSKGEPLPVMSILLEGIRRHDELKQACMVVPDDLALKPTAHRPSPDPEENDPTIIHEVWLKASGGGRVADWEREISADAYRVRRLVARWLEEGALQPA
jgi:hypothetical protein